ANLGRQPTVTTGQVVGRKLEITTRQGDRSSRHEIPWSASDHGFFYEQTSLKNKPMVPGEKRSFSALLPIFHRLAQTELTAGQWSNTKLLSDAQELLPIHSRTTLAGQQFEATLWMDRTGRILRTDEPTLSQSTIRTTKAKALAGQDAAPPDLIVGTVIPLKGSRADFSPLTPARYRVQVTSAQSGPPFPNTPRQTCKAGEQRGTWELIVQPNSQASDSAAGPFAADRPTPADRQASRMIEHENDVIQQLARDVPAIETELRLAAALTQQVNAWIEQKDFSAALASAAEVARTQRGDCTEHAVLLAALARARGLPARVVLGLVYVPTLGGFGYHMWNQIWCDGEWHDFDATRASGKCGAGHIQIAVTPLDDASGLVVFLPVLKVMGGTQIELSELEK
ncbi:MAG: transglutaminase-like domain-containing protein, partial [Pirellulales bacterium]|nr:transglutaminase-like domain-containing protein [Pirellulales bacterium]